MKSRVINKTNREILSNALTTLALKDEFVGIRELLIQASDLTLPLYDTVMDEIKSASPIVNQFVKVVDVDNVDLSEDKRFPLLWIKGKSVSYPYRYNIEELVLDGEGSTNYPVPPWELGDNPEWLAEEIEARKWRFRNFPKFRLEELEVLSDRVVYRGGWDSMTLSKGQCDILRPAMEVLLTANDKAVKLGDTFYRLASDIEGNIDQARTTKNLLEAWPEIEPFLERLYPSGDPFAVETPLGNIVLRHVAALPAPAAAE